MTQKARILALLREQGSATNAELNTIAFRYAARLAELRADGHPIKTEHVRKGLWRFTLIGADANRHRTDTFLEDGGGIGWQCFTCGQENVGYQTIARAETAADTHENEAA